MNLKVPSAPDPAAGITLTYKEFLEGIATMRKVDFPIERDPEQAWADFVGWRVNYEAAAYAIAYAIDAVPALWSGPRRQCAGAHRATAAGRGPGPPEITSSRRKSAADQRESNRRFSGFVATSDAAVASV